METYGDFFSMHGKSCERQPHCSILIPAYQYPEGISRILDGLTSIDVTEFEIIISDDSSTDCIEKLVESHDLARKGIIKYHRNSPGLGAVNNWNHLISIANSEVLVLLHHDEFFLNPRDFYRAVNQISCGKADVVVGRVKLLNNTGQRSVTHFPLFLSRFLICKLPEYIYFRNFIGPVSCLIYRRSLSVFFDLNLRWFVDVDFYYRLRLVTKEWLFLDYHSVCSIINRPASISGQIKRELKAISKVERNYLCNSRGLKILPRLQSSFTFKCVEFIGWAAYRLVWNPIRFILGYFSFKNEK